MKKGKNIHKKIKIGGLRKEWKRMDEKQVKENSPRQDKTRRSSFHFKAFLHVLHAGE